MKSSSQSEVEERAPLGDTKKKSPSFLLQGDMNIVPISQKAYATQMTLALIRPPLEFDPLQAF